MTDVLKFHISCTTTFDTCLGFVFLNRVEIHAWKHCKRIVKSFQKYTHMYLQIHIIWRLYIIQCVWNPVTEKKFGMLIEFNICIEDQTNPEITYVLVRECWSVSMKGIHSRTATLTLLYISTTEKHNPHVVEISLDNNTSKCGKPQVIHW